MKCAACSATMAHKEMGEIELRIGGKLHLVRNVSYEECPSCGERVLAPEVSQTLYDRIKNREYIEQTIKVPVPDGRGAPAHP